MSIKVDATVQDGFLLMECNECPSPALGVADSHDAATAAAVQHMKMHGYDESEIST